MKETPNRINWFDVETTGLHADCRLLEAALVITDNDLNVLGAANAVIHQDVDAALAEMDDWCRTTHTNSGLVEAVRTSATSHSDASSLFLSLMEEHESLNGILGGSSVHFDRRVLLMWLPAVHDALSYRNFDVTTIKEAVRRWWPVSASQLPRPSGEGAHRAMPDIQESIRQAKALREMLMLHPRAAGLEEATGRPYMK